MLRSKGQKMLAMLAAIAVVSCAIGGAVITETETEDSDGFVWFCPLVVFGLGAITGAVGMYTGQELWAMLTGSGSETETIVRNNEADSVADSIAVGMRYYDNALDNYDQIWKLTDEHWIRQAELASSFKWESGATFSPHDVLIDAGVYLNSSFMIYNACTQVNHHFESISERLGLWNNTNMYKNKMSIGWSSGTSSMMSKSSFGGVLGTAISVTSDSNNKAFLSGGILHVFGGSAKITSSSGKTITLTEGANNLNTITGFESNVYEFQSGRQYCGTILNVNESGSATVHAGMVVKSGDSTKLATLKGDKISIDGVSYNNLSLRIAPDGGTTQTVSVKSALVGLDSIISTIQDTIINASDSALSVWDIFTKCRHATSFLTTLAVPNNIDNINISQAQRECITILALEQLAEYWQHSDGKIKTDNYNLSNGSMQLFCRGDIYDKDGTKLYTNITFTPFYYGSDITVSTGNNLQTQPSVIAIWDDSGTNLSGWNAQAHISKMGLVSLGSGSKLDIHEMMFNNSTVSSVDLKIKNIDIIEGNDIDPTPLPEPQSHSANWFKFVMFLLAAVGIVGGLLLRRTELVLIGIVALAIGLIAGTWLWNLISGRLL